MPYPLSACYSIGSQLGAVGRALSVAFANEGRLSSVWPGPLSMALWPDVLPSDSPRSFKDIRVCRRALMPFRRQADPGYGVWAALQTLALVCRRRRHPALMSWRKALPAVSPSVFGSAARLTPGASICRWRLPPLGGGVAQPSWRPAISTGAWSARSPWLPLESTSLSLVMLAAELALSRQRFLQLWLTWVRQPADCRR